MSKSDQEFIVGRCLCEAVEYHVVDDFSYAFNCHCSQCRRATGSAFKPFAGIRREAITVVRGKSKLNLYGDTVNACDCHCSLCGSLLFSVVRDGEFAHVTLGTLVDPPSIRVEAHIFVGSKAPWFEITDNLPQHLELPLPSCDEQSERQ